MYSPLRPTRRSVITVCVLFLVGVVLICDAFINLAEMTFGYLPFIQLLGVGVLSYYVFGLPYSFYSEGSVIYYKAIVSHSFAIRDLQPEVEKRKSILHGRVYKFTSHIGEGKAFEIKSWHWGEEQIETTLKAMGFILKDPTLAPTARPQDR